MGIQLAKYRRREMQITMFLQQNAKGEKVEVEPIA